VVFYTLDSRIDQPYVTSWCTPAYINTANLGQPVTIPSSWGASNDWKVINKTATYISLYGEYLENFQVPNTIWSDVFSAAGDKNDYRAWWLGLDVNEQARTADRSSIYSLWAFVLSPTLSNATRLDFFLCPENAARPKPY
jgi:hypothetical protein